MSKKLTKSEVLIAIRSKMNHGDGGKVAKEIGIHPSYLSQILGDEKLTAGVPAVLLARFGFKETVTYTYEKIS